MSLTDEQRDKLQVSIDFLKLDIWKKYTDEDDIETLVIGNVNHIELCIAKLTSSEQEWKERAERAQNEWGATIQDGETLKRQLESVQSRTARLIKKWKLRARLADKQEIRALRANEQLEKAIEVLKFYADGLTYDIEHLSKHGYIVIDKDGGKRGRDFLSSLSRERMIL